MGSTSIGVAALSSSIDFLESRAIGAVAVAFVAAWVGDGGMKPSIRRANPGGNAAAMALVWPINNLPSPSASTPAALWACDTCPSTTGVNSPASEPHCWVFRPVNLPIAEVKALVAGKPSKAMSALLPPSINGACPEVPRTLPKDRSVLASYRLSTRPSWAAPLLFVIVAATASKIPGTAAERAFDTIPWPSPRLDAMRLTRAGAR